MSGSSTEATRDAPSPLEPAVGVDARAPAPNEAASAPPTPGSEPASPAPSAPAGTEAESRDDLLSVVQKAVEEAGLPRERDDAAAGTEAGSEAGAASPTAQAGNDTATGTGEADLPELTPQEIDSFKPDTRRRIKQLLHQRDTARSEAAEFRGDAEQHRKVQHFMREYDLSPDETARGFIAMAAAKRGDAKRFLEEVGPLVDWARQAMGITLPQDLEARVREGRIDYQSAAELARSRHAQAVAGFEAQRQGAARQATDEAVVQTQRAGDVKQAIETWEREKRGSDVDFPHIEHALKRTVQALISQHGPPPDGEAARALVDAAYTEAKRMMQRVVPLPREVRAGPSGASSATSRTTREPQTMEEAVQRGLERIRA